MYSELSVIHSSGGEKWRRQLHIGLNTNTVTPQSVVLGCITFPDPSFNFYGPQVNHI
jgi:hypothetical protein